MKDAGAYAVPGGIGPAESVRRIFGWQGLERGTVAG